MEGIFHLKNDNISQILISDDDEREQKIHDIVKDRRSLNINIELSKQLTTGQKAADRLSIFAGSWKFIAYFTVVVLAWGLLNTRAILKKPFDPYPYVFLNLILACLSSIQAPIIMMSQNREAEKDRLRAENEYLINQKSEIILEDLHMKIDDIMNRQYILEKHIDDIIKIIEADKREFITEEDRDEEHPDS